MAGGIGRGRRRRHATRAGRRMLPTMLELPVGSVVHRYGVAAAGAGRDPRGDVHGPHRAPRRDRGRPGDHPPRRPARRLLPRLDVDRGRGDPGPPADGAAGRARRRAAARPRGRRDRRGLAERPRVPRPARVRRRRRPPPRALALLGQGDGLGRREPAAGAPVPRHPAQPRHHRGRRRAGRCWRRRRRRSRPRCRWRRRSSSARSLDDFEASFVCGDQRVVRLRGQPRARRGLPRRPRQRRAGGLGQPGRRGRARHQPAVPGHRHRRDVRDAAARRRPPSLRRYAASRSWSTPPAPAGSPRPAACRSLRLADKADLPGLLHGACDERLRRLTTSPARTSSTDAGFLLALAAAALAGLRHHVHRARATSWSAWSARSSGVRGHLIAACCAGRRWSAVVIGLVVVLPARRAALPARAGIRAYAARRRARCRRSATRCCSAWKELLTTLPPVDGAGPLLVLPWALGLATGLLGAVLTSVAPGPALLRPPLPLLAAALLLAARDPARRPAPAVAVGAGRRVRRARARLAGASARRASRRPVRGGAGPVRRLGAARRWSASPARSPCRSHLGHGRRRRDRVVLRTLCRAAVRHRPVPLAARVVPRATSSCRQASQDPDQPLRRGSLFTVEGAPGRRSAADRHPRPLRRHGVGRRQRRASPAAPTTPSSASPSVIDNPVEGDAVDVPRHPRARATPASGCRRSARSSRCASTIPGARPRRSRSATTWPPRPPSSRPGCSPGDGYPFTAVRPGRGRDGGRRAARARRPTPPSRAGFLDTQAVVVRPAPPSRWSGSSRSPTTSAPRAATPTACSRPRRSTTPATT